MHQNSKFIFINQVTGYLFIDIVNAFAEDHPVELYTGQVDTIKVAVDPAIKQRFFIRYNRNVSYKRIFTWLMFTVQVFFRLLFLKKGPELFIVTNPPFGPFLGYFFHKLKGTRFHLLIYDVYPDALVKFGMIKKMGIVDRIWSKCNRHLFKHAASVFTLSNNMALLVKTYLPDGDVQVIHNWTDTSFIKPVLKNINPFAKQYNQQNKITIMYSGNMGATHAVEKIAELAAAFKNDSSFGFLLIGDGAKKEIIQGMKKEQELHNLSILNYQSSETLPYSLATADIGIVTLSSGAEDLSVPSKTYNLLAAGVALLVISSPNSELANLVHTYACGVQFEEHETAKMIAFLEEMKLDTQKLNEMKLNARKASYQFTPANAYMYKSLLNNNVHVS